jgi:hypothetical protein
MAVTKTFIEKLIRQLTEATKNGEIQWKKRKTIFESDTSRHFTTSLKNDVKINVEIRVDLSTKKLSDGNTVVYHKDLTDGRLFVHYEESSDLLAEMFSHLIAPNLKDTNDDKILSDIIDNIPNKVSIRDEKIEKIIDTKSHIENLKKSLFSIFKKLNKT